MKPLAAVVLLLLAGAPAHGDDAKQTDARSERPAAGWSVRPFAIDDEQAGFHVGLTGYVQADFRSYQGWSAAEDARYPTAGWRRVRVGIEGRWQRLRFQLDVAPVLQPGKELQDAWLELRILRELRVRAGHQKMPLGVEWLFFLSKTDFLERAAIVDALSPDRDWGVQLLGELGRLAEYRVGVFEGDGRTRANRAGTTVAGKLVLKPASWLDLTGSAALGQVKAGAGAKAKGFEESSLTGWTFFDPLHVDGRRLRRGVDVRVQSGPAALSAEYLDEREQRRGQGLALEDLPDVRGRGFALTGTWLLTGEKKVRTIRPRRALFGGPGAVEIAARYEEAHADDVANQGPEATGSRAANVRPAAFSALTGGVSWWPAPMLRLMGNVVLERYGDPPRAPEPGHHGSYVSLLARVQLMLP